MSSANVDNILLASTSAALCIDMLFHPLDTIKTRVQSEDRARWLQASSSGRLRPSPALFRGLYQGVGSVVAASLPSAAAFFVTYEWAQSSLRQLAPSSPSPQHNLLVDLGAASIGDLVASLVYTPADILKHNAQAQVFQKSPSTSVPMTSSVPAFPPTFFGAPGGEQSNSNSVWKKLSSPRYLFRAYRALALHSLPYSLVKMPLYETFKSAFSTRGPDEQPSAPSSVTSAASTAALSSGLASAIASVTTAPMDVVRVRIMLDTPAGEKSRSRNVIGVAREILKTEGIRGLYRGVLLNSGMMVIGSSMYFGLYEGGKTWLGASDEG